MGSLSTLQFFIADTRCCIGSDFSTARHLYPGHLVVCWQRGWQRLSITDIIGGHGYFSVSFSSFPSPSLSPTFSHVTFLRYSFKSTQLESNNVTTVEGIITVIFGIICFFTLPHTPAEAKFLTEEERIVAMQRMKMDYHGATAVEDVNDEHFQWHWVRMALLAPQTWFCSLAWFFLLVSLYVSFIFPLEIHYSPVSHSRRSPTPLQCAPPRYYYISLLYSISLLLVSLSVIL